MGLRTWVVISTRNCPLLSEHVGTVPAMSRDRASRPEQVLCRGKHQRLRAPSSGSPTLRLSLSLFPPCPLALLKRNRADPELFRYGPGLLSPCAATYRNSRSWKENWIDSVPSYHLKWKAGRYVRRAEVPPLRKGTPCLPRPHHLARTSDKLGARAKLPSRFLLTFLEYRRGSRRASRVPRSERSERRRYSVVIG